MYTEQRNRKPSPSSVTISLLVLLRYLIHDTVYNCVSCSLTNARLSPTIITSRLKRVDWVVSCSRLLDLRAGERQSRIMHQTQQKTSTWIVCTVRNSKTEVQKQPDLVPWRRCILHSLFGISLWSRSWNRNTLLSVPASFSSWLIKLRSADCLRSDRTRNHLVRKKRT